MQPFGARSHVTSVRSSSSFAGTLADGTPVSERQEYEFALGQDDSVPQAVHLAVKKMKHGYVCSRPAQCSLTSCLLSTPLPPRRPSESRIRLSL